MKPGDKIKSKQPYGTGGCRTGTVIAPHTAQQKSWVKHGFLVVMLDRPEGAVEQMVDSTHFEIVGAK